MAPSSPAKFSNKMFSLLCRTNIVFCIICIFIIGFFPRAKLSLESSRLEHLESFQQLESRNSVSEHSPDSPNEHRLHMNDNSSSVVIADAPSQRVLSRRRRSVLQLASMLKCVTGCSPLAFHGYGCFCGYMGDGAPVDPIDTCCLEHDWCYSATRCSHLSTYLLPYHWNCAGPGIAYCSLTDSFSPHYGCAQQLCECDLQFARCINRYPCPGRRAGCHHGARSLLKDVVNSKAALYGWQIQNSDDLHAASHLIDHIFEDDGKEIKRKSKKKITLGAGIHQVDSFTNNRLLPNVHLNVQVESESEESKKKPPINKINIKSHDTTFVGLPTSDSDTLPNTRPDVVGAAFPQSSPGFILPASSQSDSAAFSPGAFGDNSEAAGNSNSGGGASFVNVGQSDSSGTGSSSSSNGNPALSGNPALDGEVDFTGSTASPENSVGLPGNSVFPLGFGSTNAVDDAAYQGQFNFGQAGGVSAFQEQHESGRGSGIKKQSITQKQSSISVAEGKNSEKLALAPKLGPKFDKVFRHDVDVAFYLRTSPRPAATGLSGSSQGWFTKYYDSISKLANRNVTKSFELFNQSEREDVTKQKRGNNHPSTASPSVTSFVRAAQQKKHHPSYGEYYDEVATKSIARHDPRRVSYDVDDNRQNTKTSKLLFPDMGRY